MNEFKYLVDNNALGFIGSKRRASAFFRENCRLPEDVFYEARFASDTQRFVRLVEHVTPAVLHRLVQVMKSLPPDETDLIDLYANKGAADPLLVATALVLKEHEDSVLFPDEWMIVTRDRAVNAKAVEFGVRTATPEDLTEAIDAAPLPISKV